jgi:diguanylate cyclase (GGDEF)-like protein
VPIKRLLVLVLVAWSLQIAAMAAATASTLELKPSARIPLLGTADAHVDLTEKAGIDEITQTTTSWSRDARIPSGNDAQQTPVWYRFRLEGRSPADTYAIVWPGIIGRVDLYCDAGNGTLSHESGGYDSPEKSLTDHILVLPDGAYDRTCYLRALTGYHLSSPSILLLAKALKLQWSMAPSYGGFFLAIALFNLLMFVVLRQPPLLIYTLTVATALLVLVTDDVAWRYIPSTPFSRELIHEFFGWFYFAMTAYFARVFLELPEFDPKVARAMIVLVGLSALDLVAGLFPARPPWIDDVTLAFLILLLLTIVAAGYRAARRGYRGARFFIVGSIGVLVGVTTNIVVESLALPVPKIVVDLYAIGVAWEALWLTVALADRMNEIARENENLKLSRAELQVLAELDPLTGIPNRRAFDNQLQIGWARTLRAGTSLGVIMIDVDHFKEYNDAEGHVEGDLCLTKIAQACAASMMRNGDFLARYGGEEFGGILVTKTDDDIAVVAERMRVAVAELAIPHPTNPNGIVTISLGVARIRPSTRDNPLELVDAADEALYAAKSRGRNQVGTTLLATT